MRQMCLCLACFCNMFLQKKYKEDLQVITLSCLKQGQNRLREQHNPTKVTAKMCSSGQQHASDVSIFQIVMDNAVKTVNFTKLSLKHSFSRMSKPIHNNFIFCLYLSLLFALRQCVNLNISNEFENPFLLIIPLINTCPH